MMKAAPQTSPRATRRGLAAALVAAFALALAIPGPASAGEYTISICQADGAGYASTAFEDFATRGMKWRRACKPIGPGLRGLVTVNVAGTGHVARGSESAFLLSAPPETTFSRLRWSGQAHRRDCRYALQLYAERPGTSPVAIKNVRANRSCPLPDRAQASSWPRLRAYDLGGATRIVQRVVCVGGPSHEFCSARGQNYIRTFAAEATVIDGVAPSIGVVAGSPLARGEWVADEQNLDYDASDNVGIKSATALIGGQERGSHPRTCDYSQRVPCSSGRGSISVDTRGAPEGSQPLTVLAEDGAGNRAESATVTVHIDNAPPGAVSVGVGGGEVWRNSNDFDIAWVNSAEPDRAPIIAAHYRLCRSGSGECAGGDRAGTAIAAIGNLAVPSPGDWELRLWREDAAGNQEASNASEPVRLRFDPEPPQLGFEMPNAGDPTRVSVQVTDRISGLGGGEIEISRAGSGTWQVLQTSQEGDRLIARIDDASLPPGDYELRASARDQAGNLAGTDRRLDGQPMRLRLPLRIATSMKAGVIERRTFTHKGEKVRQAVLDPRAKVSFGQGVRFGGAVVNRAGHPLADAKLTVYSRPKEGDEQVDGTVMTDARGRFVYPVQVRSSRRFRFVYPGTPTILPAEDTATLLVKGYSTISVEPNRILNGDSVLFSGQVKGRPLPEAGKLLEIQFRNGGEWQTFKTLRTSSDGSWSLEYPFNRTCGVQKYPFRVHLPPEAGYPLESGVSRVVTVRVRGRPC
jgi:hypothetical protein